MALQLFKIADVTVATPQASIDFTSIPSGYTDLLIKVSCRTNNTGAGNGFNISLNSSTSSFSGKLLYGGGANAATTNTTTAVGFVNGTGETASTFASTDIYIPNYAGSNNKSMSSDSVMENNNSVAYAGLTATLWSNTAAITSISFTPATGSFVAGTTVTLYGVL